MQKYFDTWEFGEIKKIIDYDMVTAKIKCEIYIQKYPEDHLAKATYANILISFGMIDEAKEILESLLTTAYNDSSFLIDKVKMKWLIRNIKLYTLRALCYECKYEDAYNYLMSNNELIDECDLYGFVTFLNCYLKKCPTDNRSSLSYAFRQVYEYSEDDFLYHVNKHKFNEACKNNLLNDAFFSKEFPFEKALDEVRKNFTKSNKFFSGLWADKYIFGFDACGSAFGKKVNFFEVVCIHNTSNIITMFPIDVNKNNDYIDLSYLNYGEENHKSRKLSQIDKFNMRYKRT